MKFEKDIVNQARAICKHVLPEQIVQGEPPQVCLTDSVLVGELITGTVTRVRCDIKLGFLNENCVLADPTAKCRAGGRTEAKVKSLSR